MNIDADMLLLMGLGAVILLIAWLPPVLGQLPLSLPIICMLIGLGLHRTGLLALDLHQLNQNHIPEILNEAVVLISLMGAGLRLDRRFGWQLWGSTWRLLAVAMPLTILGVMLIARFGLGFGWAASLLLGAALSPTDPVLAADVQTGPPGEGEKGEVRFALTSEAGLNDGLAFPFVTLAVLLAQPAPIEWWHWIGKEFLGGMALGLLIGWLGGWAMGWAMFRLPQLKLADTGDGLVAVGVVLIAFATAQILGANGFVAVFVTAVAIRASEPDAKFQRAMVSFAEQVERVLVMLVLVLFGWALGGGLLGALSWGGVLLAVALIFVLRPAAAWIGFLGSELRWQPKALMAFFGIRGIGTLFYMQHSFARAGFGDHDALWGVVAFVVLSSIVLHGMTSTPLMRMAQRRLDERQRRAKAG